MGYVVLSLPLVGGIIRALRALIRPAIIGREQYYKAPEGGLVVLFSTYKRRYVLGPEGPLYVLLLYEEGSTIKPLRGFVVLFFTCKRRYVLAARSAAIMLLLLYEKVSNIKPRRGL